MTSSPAGILRPLFHSFSAATIDGTSLPGPAGGENTFTWPAIDNELM